MVQRQPIHLIKNLGKYDIAVVTLPHLYAVVVNIQRSQQQVDIFHRSLHMMGIEIVQSFGSSHIHHPILAFILRTELKGIALQTVDIVILHSVSRFRVQLYNAISSRPYTTFLIYKHYFNIIG